MREADSSGFLPFLGGAIGYSAAALVFAMNNGANTNGLGLAVVFGVLAGFVHSRIGRGISLHQRPAQFGITIISMLSAGLVCCVIYVGFGAERFIGP